MVLLGLLLMLGCIALAVDAVVQNTSVMHAIAFNQPIDHLSLGALFVAGCVVGLLFALGMAMFVGGLGRAFRIRRERRVLRRETADSVALREHNARLEQELADRDSGAYPDEPATTGATRDTTGTAATTPTGRHASTD
jgi:hypothetical protein